MSDGCIAVTDTSQAVLNAAVSATRDGYLHQLQRQIKQLNALLPFAASYQASMIQSALEIAQEAKAAPPIKPPENTNSAAVTFYTVYIPTLDGRFYYLSDTNYLPGEIVCIPFGCQDKEIFGIVEGSQCYPYGKAPLPMWKMKYILGKAPKPVADEYRRHSTNHPKVNEGG